MYSFFRLQSPRTHTKQGVSLVEVIVGSAIFAGSMIALVYVSVNALELERMSLMRTHASLLATEGVEAVRFLRDNDWETIGNVPLGEDRGIGWGGAAWEMIDSPTAHPHNTVRSISFSPVYRDSMGAVAEFGSEDARARRVLVRVSWESRGTTEVYELENYVFDIFRD